MKTNNFSCLLYTNTSILFFKVARLQTFQFICQSEVFVFHLPSRMHFWEETLRGAFPDLSVLLVLLWMQDLPLTYHVLSFHIICCYFCLTIKEIQEERKKTSTKQLCRAQVDSQHLFLEARLTKISLHLWCWGTTSKAACLCLQGGGWASKVKQRRAAFQQTHLDSIPCRYNLLYLRCCTCDMSSLLISFLCTTEQDAVSVLIFHWGLGTGTKTLLWV